MRRLDAGDVVLKMVLDNPGITQPEIRQVTGLLKSTINKKLNEFVIEGRLKRKPLKMGRYNYYQYYQDKIKIENYFHYIVENIGDSWMTRPDFLNKTGISPATLTQRMQKLEAGGYVRVKKEKINSFYCLLYKVLKPYDGGLEVVKKKSTYKQHKTELEWEMAQYKAKEQLRNIFNKAMGMA